MASCLPVLVVYIATYDLQFDRAPVIVNEPVDLEIREGDCCDANDRWNAAQDVVDLQVPQPRKGEQHAEKPNAPENHLNLAHRYQNGVAQMEREFEIDVHTDSRECQNRRRGQRAGREVESDARRAVELGAVSGRTGQLIHGVQRLHHKTNAQVWERKAQEEYVGRRTQRRLEPYTRYYEGVSRNGREGQQDVENDAHGVDIRDISNVAWKPLDVEAGCPVVSVGFIFHCSGKDSCAVGKTTPCRFRYGLMELLTWDLVCTRSSIVFQVGASSVKAMKIEIELTTMFSTYVW